MLSRNGWVTGETLDFVNDAGSARVLQVGNIIEEASTNDEFGYFLDTLMVDKTKALVVERSKEDRSHSGDVRLEDAVCTKLLHLVLFDDVRVNVINMIFMLWF